MLSRMFASSISTNDPLGIFLIVVAALLAVVIILKLIDRL